MRTKNLTSNYIHLDDDPDLGENVFVAGFPYNFDTLNFTSGAISALVGPEKYNAVSVNSTNSTRQQRWTNLDEWGSLVGVTFARIDDLYVRTQELSLKT